MSTGVGLPLSGSAGAAAVVERLAARQQQLAAEREQRQAHLQAQADVREDVSGFLQAYQSSLGQLQQRCEILKAETSAVQQDAAAKATLLEELEALSLAISNKEHDVSAAAYFLPPYELRSCTSQLQQLRLQLADTKQQLQPKRKFAFSKAVSRTNISTSAASSKAQALQVASAAAAATVSPSTTTNPCPAAATSGPPADGHASTQGAPALSTQDQQLIAAGHGFAGHAGLVLVASAQQLAGQGFLLHHLTDCDVFLLGRMSALRLQHLQRCRVYSGPVIGATFVESCSACTIMLASYQVRIHNADACDFYLRVRSRPIIEHSTNLGFAPYAAEALLCGQAAGAAHAADHAAGQQHQQTDHQATAQQQQQEEEEEEVQQEQLVQPADGQEQQQGQCQQQGALQMLKWQPEGLLAAAQLSDDTGLWQQVDDFGWVKAAASPHWRVLPEAQRQQSPACLPLLQLQMAGATKPGSA